MTTPTPTSETGPGSALPDVASLTALANELFRQPPGGGPAASAAPGAPTRPVSFGPPPIPSVPVAGGFDAIPHPTSIAPLSPPMPVSQSAVAQHLAPPSLITPRIVPTMAQSPDPAAATATLAPAAGRSAGPIAGVPEAYAAQTPPPMLGEVTAPAGPPLAPASTAPAASQPGTSAASPSRDSAALAGLDPLAGLPSAPTVAGFPAPSNAPAPSTPYYFVGESSGYPAMATGDAEGRKFERPGAPAGSSAPPAGASSVPAFYFADPAVRGSRPEGAPRGEGVPQLPPVRGAFDVHAVRRDFPILRERVNGRPLIWFDNAATTQKPQSVIDRLAYFYAHENSNIHRAAHELAARATDAYESARHKVAKFLGASSAQEIVFVRGATEAINLVAFSWGRQNVRSGDEIVVSHLEHHANIVPWQMLATETGAKLRVIPVDDSGQLRLDEFRRLLNDRTKLVAVTHVSNALGTVVPVREVIDIAHRVGARVLVDGAQSVSHMRVDVRALDADFYVFSGHKIFGPTGIGAVYGKRELLEDMPPYQGGGNMIEDVTFEQTRYHGPPTRFEAGTGNIADAVGLGAALDYVERIGLESIARYEHELLEYGTSLLKTIPGLRLIGTARDKASVMSFTLAGWKNDEVGKALNQEGIAVRTGHHCAQPILRRFGVESTVRPSVAFYNTCEEIDAMIAVLKRLARLRA